MHEPGQQRHVERGRRLDGERPDALDAERGLRQDCPAEQDAEIEAEHRHDRQHARCGARAG